MTFTSIGFNCVCFYEKFWMSSMSIYLPPFYAPKLHKSVLTFMTTKFIILDGAYFNNRVTVWGMCSMKKLKTAPYNFN